MVKIGLVTQTCEDESHCRYRKYKRNKKSLEKPLGLIHHLFAPDYTIYKIVCFTIPGQVTSLLFIV
jgi:hypothetical protein